MSKITISEEARKAAVSILALETGAVLQNKNLKHPDFSIALTQQVQLAINSETAPLQKRIEALQKQVTPMACEVCWTNSWEPAEESDKDAVRDPTIAGKWMRCAHCLIVEGLLSQKKRIEELEQKLTTYEGKTNFCCERGGTKSRIEELEKHLLAMREALQLIRHEHSMTMQEVMSEGYSEGLALKPSLFDKVECALNSTPANLASKYVKREVLEKCVVASKQLLEVRTIDPCDPNRKVAALPIANRSVKETEDAYTVLSESLAIARKELEK